MKLFVLKFKKGFSIIEVIISIGLLGFMILASTFLISQQQNQISSQKTKLDLYVIKRKLNGIIADTNLCSCNLSQIANSSNQVTSFNPKDPKSSISLSSIKEKCPQQFPQEPDFLLINKEVILRNPVPNANQKTNLESKNTGLYVDSIQIKNIRKSQNNDEFYAQLQVNWQSPVSTTNQTNQNNHSVFKNFLPIVVPFKFKATLSSQNQNMASFSKCMSMESGTSEPFSNIACGPNTYLNGFDTLGNPICKAATEPSETLGSQILLGTYASCEVNYPNTCSRSCFYPNPITNTCLCPNGTNFAPAVSAMAWDYFNVSNKPGHIWDGYIIDCRITPEIKNMQGKDCGVQHFGCGYTFATIKVPNGKHGDIWNGLLGSHQVKAFCRNGVWTHTCHATTNFKDCFTSYGSCDGTPFKVLGAVHGSKQIVKAGPYSVTAKCDDGNWISTCERTDGACLQRQVTCPNNITSQKITSPFLKDGESWSGSLSTFKLTAQCSFGTIFSSCLPLDRSCLEARLDCPPPSSGGQGTQGLLTPPISANYSKIKKSYKGYMIDATCQNGVWTYTCN